MSGSPLFIRAMYGFGDSVYQRPFIRAQANVRPVFVTTPFPEVYADLPDVHPVKPPHMRLRTQAKNVERHARWASPPVPHVKAHFTYCLRKIPNIMRELETHVSLAGQPFVFDLPDFGASPVQTEKPIAVIRPVTIRAEWKNAARAPRPEYIAQAAQILRNTGFHVVAVADIEPGQEWLLGEMPEADEYFVHGELPARDVLALTQHAAVVVGGSGWIIPVSIAQRTPLVVIGGGLGAHNAPEIVTDPRMDLTRTRFVLPDRYCRCRDSKHACDKSIREFPARFTIALAEVCNGLN